MTALPFVTLDDPRYGEAVRVSPLVERVVAQNPSMFTYHGTGTYLVGDRHDVVVIDPGPDLEAHRAALLAAIGQRTVRAVLVTHCHADHSPLAPWLAALTGSATVGFGPHPRLPDPDAEPPELCQSQPGEPVETDKVAGVEETTDYDFDPDRRVVDGEIAAEGAAFTLRAVHTPGHTSNHLCFALEQERALFTGDHIMGWSTTVIGPPDGNMRAYFESLRKVQARDDAVFLPTHGAPVTETRPFLTAFMAHRLEREAQVLAVVRSGQSSIAAMVETLYVDVRAELHKPAGRSVLAHLVKLVDDGLVVIDDQAAPSLRALYRPAQLY
ncbi:MAG: hypothetical protein RLZZ623_1081 [Actinomycetota bacterium]